MLKGLSNGNGAGHHKVLGFLLGMVILIAGCTTVPEKNWNCTHPDEEGKWSCTSVDTSLGRYFECQDEAYRRIDGTTNSGTNSDNN